jgi:Ala-tRNA(Pro) deacylase
LGICGEGPGPFAANPQNNLDKDQEIETHPERFSQSGRPCYHAAAEKTRFAHRHQNTCRRLFDYAKLSPAFEEHMDPITTEDGLLAYLDASEIEFVRVEHPPVFTCEEANRYRPPAAGLDTKNLFVRDEKRNFYLLVTACEKRLDLKALGSALGTSKLHFASPEQLSEILGLTPGSVTLLGLVNDTESRVQLVADAEYWPAGAYLCHPLVNTATLVITHDAITQFLHRTGHTPRIVLFPGRV